MAKRLGLVRSLVADHEPVEGKRRELYVARWKKGLQASIVEQVLTIDGGWQATVTIDAAAAGEYAIIVNGVRIEVNATTETAEEIRDALFDRVIRRETIIATGVFPGNKGDDTFDLISSNEFTLTTDSDDVSVSTPTESAGAAEKGDTELDLWEPLEGPIYAGQYFGFADDNGIEMVAKLTQDALPGATSVTIAPLKKAIAGGARAEFPAYVWDRTGVNLSRTFNNSTTSTFNTGANRDGTPSGAEKDLEAPGVFNAKNAGYLTALAAANDEAFVRVKIVEVPVDESGDFDRWTLVESRALVSAANSESPEEGSQSADLSFALMGGVIEGDPWT
jgi:hypothetical protein